MKRIAQRFCQGCPRMSGFTVDEDSGMWVCGNCGLPSEMYYLAHRSAQPPGVPISYAKGWTPEERLAYLRDRAGVEVSATAPTKLSSQRSRARSKN